MTFLFPFLVATFIFQACANNPDNRSDNLSDLKNNELVVAINKFLKGLELDQVVRDLLSLSEGQTLMKLNRLRNTLNISREEIMLMVVKIAEALEEYSIDDLESLSEADLVAMVQKVFDMVRTYQDMIFGKIFSASDSLRINKTKVFDNVSNFVEVINVLSKPNRVEELVRDYMDCISLVIKETVRIVRLLNLEPVIKSIIDEIKAAASKDS